MTNGSIVVEYYPAGEKSPFSDPDKTMWTFETHEQFKQWVQGYVCVYCLVDFTSFNSRRPETLHDWLEMGCGCEIGVTDESNLIVWSDTMVLPANFEDELQEHTDIMADAFDRHG